MSVVVLALDGVLRAPAGGSLASGRALYTGLASVATVAVAADEAPHSAQRWLEAEGLSSHAYLLSALVDDPQDPALRRLRQIGRLRAAGADIAFALDPDPTVIQALYAAGMTAMLALSPAYSAPRFRPDYAEHITPWGALVAEVERAERLRAGDARATEPEIL